MDERVMQFRVGVMVLATLLITGILVLLFNKPGELIPAIMPGGKYTIHVRFEQAPSVSEGTPVRKSGVLIGRVKRVDLLDDGQVIVTVKIDRNRRLRHNEVFRIADGLMGDAVVQVVPGDPHAPDTFIEDGEEAEGQYQPGAAQMMDDLHELIGVVKEVGGALQTGGEKLGTAADKITELLEKHEDEIDETAAQAKEALENLGKAAASVNNVIGDEPTQKRLREAVAQLPDTVAALTRAIQNAETNLDNLKEFTGTLQTDGKPRLEKIFKTVDLLEEVMTQMAVFSERLNQSEGTLGMLMKDRQLYENLSQAAENVNCLTRQLRPVVNDVRVFTDKIARHPEQLGVRGALQRSPGIK